MGRVKRFLRHYWIPLAVAAGILIPSGVLFGQINSNTVVLVPQASSNNPIIRSQGLDTNIGGKLVPKGSGVWSVQGDFLTTGNSTFNGNMSILGTLTATTLAPSFAGVQQTMFIPAAAACVADNTATPMIKVRLATGDWALARTAAGAETQNIECPIELPFRTTASKGIRVDAFSIVHQITVVNLTSATFQQMSQVTYANNVANAVTAYGGAITITLPTVVQANPYVTAATVGTPAFANATNNINIDYQVVMANTGVYRLYGILLTFTQALY